MGERIRVTLDDAVRQQLDDTAKRFGLGRAANALAHFAQAFVAAPDVLLATVNQIVAAKGGQKWPAEGPPGPFGGHPGPGEDVASGGPAKGRPGPETGRNGAGLATDGPPAAGTPDALTCTYSTHNNVVLVEQQRAETAQTVARWLTRLTAAGHECVDPGEHRSRVSIATAISSGKATEAQWRAFERGYDRSVFAGAVAELDAADADAERKTRERERVRVEAETKNAPGRDRLAELKAAARGPSKVGDDVATLKSAFGGGT